MKKIEQYVIEYSESIAKRIKSIMIMSDLDIAGFAEFFEKSTSHIYGILNKTRPLSESFSTEIGQKFDFGGTKVPQDIPRSKVNYRGFLGSSN